ncbi:MAG: DUF2442 domain-containing protein [Chlorobiaceae bacterium]|nr:DUF2442 domain-containing protein [Chlorobiaceae bacterium]
MNIIDVKANPDKTLSVIADNGYTGTFDVKPYLKYEAFEALNSTEEFLKIMNGGYFVEWNCGADLSADTIEAYWTVIGRVSETA